MRLSFEDLSSANGPIVLDDPLLVVAGFTGRDQRAVAEHISELNEIGVSAPERSPSLYALPNWLLRVDVDAVQVGGGETSGEAEPVLVRPATGGLYVTVGSDHTDRALERISFGVSKIACPKTVCGRLWNVDDIGEEWDQLRIQGYTGEGMEPYQSAQAAELLSPNDLLALIETRIPRGRPLVLFMGTVSLLCPGFRFSDRFTARLTRGSDELESAYDIEIVDGLDASLAGLASTITPLTAAVAEPRSVR